MLWHRIWPLLPPPPATMATPWRRAMGPCHRTRRRRTLVGRSHIRKKQPTFSYPRVWKRKFSKVNVFSYPKSTFSYLQIFFIPSNLFHTLKIFFILCKTFFIFCKWFSYFQIIFILCKKKFFAKKKIWKSFSYLIASLAFKRYVHLFTIEITSHFVGGSSWQNYVAQSSSSPTGWLWRAPTAPTCQAAEALSPGSMITSSIRVAFLNCQFRATHKFLRVHHVCEETSLSVFYAQAWRHGGLYGARH